MPAGCLLHAHRQPVAQAEASEVLDTAGEQRLLAMFCTLIDINEFLPPMLDSAPIGRNLLHCKVGNSIILPSKVGRAGPHWLNPLEFSLKQALVLNIP